MGQPLSFADSEYQNKRRQTRKEKLLERMSLWLFLTQSGRMCVVFNLLGRISCFRIFCLIDAC